MCSTTIPSSFYEAKRKFRDLNLGYETIHVCKYDCVLYWKEFADLQHCPTCSEARYKVNHNRGKKFRKRDKRVETDDVLRHPADNVRLGLASDGFNSFGQMSTLYTIMSSSYQRNNFMETDAMFLEFEDDLDNIAGGSSSLGDNTGSSSQQPATPTPRRHAQSRLLELERHVAAIGVCVRKTFPICCLKWADVGREYIEVVKGNLQRLGVLDFNDQAMNSCAFQEQSQTNKAARQKQPYNHNSGSKSFLQRQYELAKRKGESVDRVELFWKTHVRVGTFVSQAVEDAHNQMLKLQSQPTLKGSQPLSEDEICDQVLGRRPCYSKGLGWGPKPKARRTTSASSSSTSCSQSTKKEIELQAKLNETLERIDVQDRNHQVLASQVETMKKMIEEFIRAQQGPPHDP
ncbi:CACTA en-spm transposon protein [Cucumis melo var. makuwa]|uniref:CACTA en-spm transposon protein n=1 Tax=Cucumis melo var. makuwa TaxID=1194695 RepID=A0A5D3CH15_CUCMM|nr:CACTA en-spm transposon protein [Cucumis melo var. makuwa]